MESDLGPGAAAAQSPLAHRLANLLRDEIITHALTPGAVLREQSLAARFHCSRIPVREALRHLAAERYVTIAPYRGAVVTAVSQRDGEEIFELRLTLTALALSHAVPRLTPARLSRAEALLAAMEATDGINDWSDLASAFYLTLLEAAERPRLLEMLRGLLAQSKRYQAVLFTQRALRDLIHANHHRLLAVCRQGDPEAAVRCFEANMRSVADTLRAQQADLLRRMETSPPPPIEAAAPPQPPAPPPRTLPPSRRRAARTG